jgi:hypothetical protein
MLKLKKPFVEAAPDSAPETSSSSAGNPTTLSSSSSTPSSSSSSAAAPKFSALLGHRASVQSVTASNKATSVTEKIVAPVVTAVAANELLAAREKERGADADHAALFAVAAAVRDDDAGESLASLRSALPADAAQRRNVVAAASDKAQQRLLHVVVAPSAAQWLVRECRADVTARDRKGNTPLHAAAKAANAPLCAAFLELVSVTRSHNFFTPKGERKKKSEKRKEKNRFSLSHLQSLTHSHLTLTHRALL